MYGKKYIKKTILETYLRKKKIRNYLHNNLTQRKVKTIENKNSRIYKIWQINGK